MTKHHQKRNYYNSGKLTPLLQKYKLVTNDRDKFERTLYIAVVLSFVKITSHIESQLSISEQGSVTHQDITEIVNKALPY